MNDDNNKYFWYVFKTNTYLSKEESKPIIERKIKINEKLINKISKIYLDYKFLLDKSDGYKNKDDINYLFSTDDAISFICMEFEEIIKEFEKND